MSKSTLSIAIYLGNFPISGKQYRTIEVPCRLPDSFTFWFKQTGYGNAKATALLNDFDEPKAVSIAECELLVGIGNEDGIPEMDTAAKSILATIKAALGITGPVPPGSPLPSIALAYEAECAAYDACLSAHASLPRVLSGDAVYWSDPREGHSSAAARMLAKYVEHVVQNAAAQVMP